MDIYNFFVIFFKADLHCKPGSPRTHRDLPVFIAVLICSVNMNKFYFLKFGYVSKSYIWETVGFLFIRDLKSGIQINLSQLLGGRVSPCN